MPIKHTKDIFQYFLSNIWIGVLLIIIPLFFMDLFLDEPKLKDQVILLDKTFENIDEIYINNDFGKSIILHVPSRSRIIVQQKEYSENNTYMIKINIIKQGCE